MSHRLLELLPASANARSRDLVLRSPPDRLFTPFFSLLSALHASIAVAAFWNGRWEGYLSAIFCLVFAAVAVACRLFRTVIRFHSASKHVQIHSGVGPLGLYRRLPYGDITAVRLTMLGRDGTTIELLCPYDEVCCPPCPHAPQEALLLAMTLDVPLIKVLDDEMPQDCRPRLAT